MIQDWTSQSQKLCVKDQLLKYQLDPTIKYSNFHFTKSVQCCQQHKFSDLAIKTALTTELRLEIRPVKVKNYVFWISC